MQLKVPPSSSPEIASPASPGEVTPLTPPGVLPSDLNYSTFEAARQTKKQAALRIITQEMFKYRNHVY